MRLYIIISLLIIIFRVAGGHSIYRREATTTTAPDSDTGSEESCQDTEEYYVDDLDDEEGPCQVPDRAQMAAEYFQTAISRDRALKMLKRAVEILEKKPSAKRHCSRDANIDIDAKNALRFLTGEPTIGSTTEESSQCSSSTNQGENDYSPDSFAVDDNRKVSEQTVKRILKLHGEDNMSEKAIRSQYPWFRRQYIPRMRRFLEPQGPQRRTMDEINEYVKRKIDEALAAKKPIHEYHLKQWGFDRADELNASGFKASQNWLTWTKRNNDLVGRKVTDLASRSDQINAPRIAQSRLDFAEDYGFVSQFFPHHRIINVDQSGHRYEISNLRSLARRGSRDHVLSIDDVNKNTHSYTIQPMLGRDGRLRGKLLICFRETQSRNRPQDTFGERVAQRVEALERELGNVVAYASKSGKMSRRLTDRWIDEIVTPEIARLEDNDSESLSSQDSQATERAGPSWSFDPPETWTAEQRRIMELKNTTSTPRRPGVLLLLDSWGGHSSDDLADKLIDRNIFVLKIPRRTTADLQPLDVQVFRQYKIFVKRIIEASSYEGTIRNLTDRYGIMRMHSLIWNQLQAPVYRDMLLWAWRKTDPDFTGDELENDPPPRMTLDIQFGFDRKHSCEVPNCRNKAFIRCSHCGKHLCHQHFMARQCFHEDQEQNEPPLFVNSTGSSTTMRPPPGSGSAGAAAAAIGGSSIIAGAVGAIGASASAGVGAAGSAGAAAIAAMENGGLGEAIPLIEQLSSSGAAPCIEGSGYECVPITVGTARQLFRMGFKAGMPGAACYKQLSGVSTLFKCSRVPDKLDSSFRESVEIDVSKLKQSK